MQLQNQPVHTNNSMEPNSHILQTNRSLIRGHLGQQENSNSMHESKHNITGDPNATSLIQLNATTNTANSVVDESNRLQTHNGSGATGCTPKTGAQNGLPKTKKTKTSKLTELNAESVFNSPLKTGVSNGQTVASLIASSSLKLPKTNANINELFEHMQQQQNMPASQQQHENANLNTTDFELRIESAELKQQSPSKHNGPPLPKKKKESKNETDTEQPSQDGSVSTTSANNTVTAPTNTTIAASPAKLTGKRRRSSLKTNDTSILSNPANSSGNTGLDLGLKLNFFYRFYICT